MKTFADKVIKFNRQLDYTGDLPDGVRIMNPFKTNKEILPISKIFYKRFYNDFKTRKLILGINPGRLGAGVTGIPFTDTKRLTEICKINLISVTTHEPSSVFIYDMIDKFGGPEIFYNRYFITAVSPLGFVLKNKKGNWINFNYYDSAEIITAMEPFFLECLDTQIRFGIDTTVCYVLGKKNSKYVNHLNSRKKLFKSIITLDHPRYIQQYKSTLKDEYISDYLSKLK